MMVVGVLRRLLVIKAQESFDVEQALQKVDSFLYFSFSFYYLYGAGVGGVKGNAGGGGGQRLQYRISTS